MKVDTESGRIECLDSRRILSSDRIQIGSRPEKTGSKRNPIMLVFRIRGENTPSSLLLCLASLPRQSRAIYKSIEKATRLKIIEKSYFKRLLVKIIH